MSHRKSFAVVAGLAVLSLVCIPAMADFDEGSFVLDFLDDPAEAYHWWSYDYDQDIMLLGEQLPVLEDSILMAASTNDDPTFSIEKEILNDTGMDWDAYRVTLVTDGSAAFVGTPTYSPFSSHTASATELYFFDGTVADGEIVMLDFDINVSTIGDFSFTLTQTAIPEPASLSLLVLGGLALLRRRKTA